MLVNDRDTEFMVGFWKYLFQKVGTNLSFNIIFHPQTNGQTEKGQWGVKSIPRKLSEQPIKVIGTNI
jgi:hypothetical protein